MFNLRNNKEYVLILLEGLKFIRDNCGKADLEHLKEQRKEIELKIIIEEEHQPFLTE